MLKLAGLLKESMEEWPRGIAEESLTDKLEDKTSTEADGDFNDVPPANVEGDLDIPMGYAPGEDQDEKEKKMLYSVYSDMYKELNNIRPRWVDPEELSVKDLQMMIDDLANEEPLEAPEGYEDEPLPPQEDEFEFMPQDFEETEEERAIRELQPSAEEEELERLPMRMGIGRGASLKEQDDSDSESSGGDSDSGDSEGGESEGSEGLDETHNDNMKEEVEEGAILRGQVKTPAGMELLKALEAIEQRIMGKQAWEEAEAELLRKKAQSVADTLEMQQAKKLQEAIRSLVREVLAEKKAKTYKGKSMRLGGGGRFAKFVDSLKKSGKSEEQARAIAYKAGAKKYGKGKMAKMAAAGRKRKKD